MGRGAGRRRASRALRPNPNPNPNPNPRTAYISSFEKPKTKPNSLEPSTTVLSPYMKFGCVSPREFWWDLEAVYTKAGKKTLPPVSLTGQLLWREFFTMTGSVTPNFDKMVGNPICRQIDWDTNPEYLAAWEEGRTGYPFIDAIMTQVSAAATTLTLTAATRS